jgi:hypothetical protein
MSHLRWPNQDVEYNSEPESDEEDKFAVREFE